MWNLTPVICRKDKVVLIIEYFRGILCLGDVDRCDENEFGSLDVII